MPKPAYRRVLVKVSGEALLGKDGASIFGAIDQSIAAP